MAAPIVLFLSCATAGFVSHAENGLVTISVDAEDDNEDLLYAIDDDSPEAFSPNHEFQVYPGTQHTIYVKDAAGNITSSTYTADNPDNTTTDPLCNDAGSSPLGDGANNTYQPVGERDSSAKLHYSAEDGQGTVYEKTYTDGSAEGDKIFYTVTTKEGEVYYLVIDQTQQNNNVYLLNQVTVSSLQGLATAEGYEFTPDNEKINSSNLLTNLKGGSGASVDGSQSVEPSAGDVAEESSGGGSLVSSSKRSVFVIALAAVGGGGWYYFKKRKKLKDDQMDEIEAAHDLEDFEAEGDDEEDDAEFEEDDDFYDALAEDEFEDIDEENDSAVESEVPEENDPVVLTDENRDDYIEMEDDEEDFDEEDYDDEEDNE